MTQPDVLVVGAGLAGLSAALAARELGASVLVLERAPREERGGNSRFSIGAMRAVYAGVDDIEKLVGDLGEAERARVDFGAYPREQYLDDMARVTQHRGDTELADLLVDGSTDTMRWLRTNGVRFRPLYPMAVQAARRPDQVRGRLGGRDRRRRRGSCRRAVQGGRAARRHHRLWNAGGGADRERAGGRRACGRGKARAASISPPRRWCSPRRLRS